MNDGRFTRMLAGITDEDIKQTEDAIDYIVGQLKQLGNNEEIEKGSILVAAMLMKYGREIETDRKA